VHEGKILSLRRGKDDVEEVSANFECGIGFGRFQDLKQGDIIETFSLEEIVPRL
jgi:translation initiation factor IF-2